MTTDEKKEKVKGLLNVINLNNRMLTSSDKEKVDALEYGLSSNLQALADECRDRELDLKIEYFGKLIKVLKHNPLSL